MDKKEEPMSFNEAVNKATNSIDRFPLIEVRGVPLSSWIAQNWSSISAFCPDPSDLLISTYPKAGKTLSYNKGPIKLLVKYLKK